MIKFKKQKAKSSSRRIFPKRLFTYSLISAGLIISLLSFTVSLELGVITFALVTVISFVAFDFRQRRFWEQAFGFRVKKTEERQDRLEMEVVRNRNDIRALKRDLMETARSVRAQSLKQPEPRTRAHSNDDAGVSALASRLERIEQKPRASAISDFHPPPSSIIRAQHPVRNEQEEEDYNHFSDAVIKELVHHAVNENGVHIFMQPILRLPQRHTRFYEMFARVRARPGAYIPAKRFLKTAQQAQLIETIDRKLLGACLNTIKNTAAEDRAPLFFINTTNQTLVSRSFMNQLLGFVAKNRSLAHRLVFEIPQKDFESASPPILEIIRGLGKLGCHFSIDHVNKPEFDIQLMQSLKIRFVKIEAQKIFQLTRDVKGYREFTQMKRQLEGNGIGLILEKIESAHMLKELLEFDIHYGQGYYLARPDRQGAFASIQPKAARSAA